MDKKYLKPPVEVLYEKELAALRENDAKNPKPENWNLSPKAIRTFILGSEKPLSLNGEKIEIKQKFYGDDSLIERCIITLAGNRGLMLVGEPGTAKTMLSELLSAAISGSSVNTVQGTAGTTEDNIKYSWNYALLLAKGPVQEALVPAPLYTGMKDGIITRVEEITRCPSEMQDTLISIMSDKVLNIPELGEEGFIFAKPGFNIIATANTRDKGVNEMSSALKRRFNFETVFPINSVAMESRIIEEQSGELLKNLDTGIKVDDDVVNIIATTFHELREGVSKEGAKIDSPSAVMSTAEAVSVYLQSALTGYFYNDGEVTMDNVVQNILGAVLKESRDDASKLKNYFNTVIKQRATKENGLWKGYYEARKWIK
ncbi:MAG: AAA family ATPase [Clostridiales bacterium]|jgi:MoxR-like ATPase|nr:AAA family ATPase [Clostridiales bacterium]